jgi:hypothetical protein
MSKNRKKKKKKDHEDILEAGKGKGVNRFGCY